MKRFPRPGALTGGLLTLALLPAFWPGGALAQEVEACTEEATDLIAGQTTVVGDVNVCNDADTLTVTYEPSSPWCLVSTALHVATSESDIPQTKNGNPKPGQFADGDDYDPCVDVATFEILLANIGDGVSPGDTVVVAANARVLNMETGAEEGAWGDGTRFVERGPWATFFTYVVEEPVCGGAGSCTVFVTSMRFTGDLVSEATELTGEEPPDGLAAGDAICQFLAEDAELQGTYKAWLSMIGGGSPVTRFTQAAVPYVLVDDDTTVADDWDDLTTDEGTPGEFLDAPISVTEGGGVLLFREVRTGTGPTGSIEDFNGLASDCEGWSDAAGALLPGSVHGWSTATDTNWTFLIGVLAGCGNRMSLYCFQQ